MAALGKRSFRGQSGQAYPFRVYALGTRFRKLSGVYVVTNRSRRAEGGYQHTVLYVGQTDDFSTPLSQQSGTATLQEHGANCICLMADGAEASRLAKTRDLVASLQPVCNG